MTIEWPVWLSVCSEMNRVSLFGRVWAVWALALVFLGLVWAQHKVLPHFVYGHVVVSMGMPSQHMALHVSMPATQTLAQCEDQIDNVVSTFRTTCPSCAVQSQVCTPTPPTHVLAALGNSPIAYPSVRMPGGGVVEYRSTSLEFALNACQETQLQSNQSMPCIQPHAERSVSTNKSKAWVQVLNSQRLYWGLLGALGLVMALLLLYGTVRRWQCAALGALGSAFRTVWVQKLFLFCTDSLLLVLAYLFLGFPSSEQVAALLRYDGRQALFHLALIVVNVLCYWVYFEQYVRRRPWWDELREIFRVLALSLLLAGAALFYANVDAGRSLIVWTWGSAFVLLPLGRIAARQVLDCFGLWRRPAYIVGTGRNAVEAYLAVRDEQSMGYVIQGFFAVNFGIQSAGDVLEIEGKCLPVLSLPPAPRALMKAYGLPEIIVALDTLSTTKAQRLLHQLTMINHNLHVIPAIRGLPLFGAKLSHFFSHEVLFLTVRNNLSRRSYQIVKRLFDVLIASLLLMVLWPLLLGLTLWVRQDGGPALYGHPRVGRNGRLFKCLKFRSMRIDSAEVLQHLLATDLAAQAEWGRDFKLRNDPRITTAGRFLRKSSLDELPQLFNVLKGEMSLVGPRPIVQEELARYGSGADYYLSVLPGITGLWQVSGRNDTTYAERVSLDAWYAQNWSLWYDLAILLKTVKVVVTRDGAY